MIFFDLDGTLLDFKGAERLAVQAYYNRYRSEFRLTESTDRFYEQWCDIGRKHYARFLQGEVTFERQQIERVKELVEALQDSEAAGHFQFYLRSFESNWKPFEDVIPCIRGLQGRHRLGIITNGDLNQQKRKLERMGISGYFEIVIASGEVGFAKPNPEIFRTASEMSGKPLHELTYVGDDLATDIIPCEKLNMRAIWLNRRNERPGAPVARTIASLNELQDEL